MLPKGPESEYRLEFMGVVVCKSSVQNVFVIGGGARKKTMNVETSGQANRTYKLIKYTVSVIWFHLCLVKNTQMSFFSTTLHT